MVNAGSPASPASSCRYGCSRGCFGVCCWKNSALRTTLAVCSSSARFSRSPMPPPSPTYLAPLRTIDWVVYAKHPFAGPEAVLAYLSRYTHRVAISNSRLIACDQRGVTFKWKDYRAKRRHRYQIMTLATPEFIRRFLIHVLPTVSTASVTTDCSPTPCGPNRCNDLRDLLADGTADSNSPIKGTTDDEPPTSTYTCPDCGAPMMIIETFVNQIPRAPPPDS